MDKSKPHHDLEKAKSLIRAGSYRTTFLALAGAKLLGFKTETEIGQFLLALGRANFYKSMTSNQNHKEWQDVYHAIAPNGKLIYIKFTVKEDVLVLSFKEK